MVCSMDHFVAREGCRNNILGRYIFILYFDVLESALRFTTNIVHPDLVDNGHKLDRCILVYSSCEI